MNKLCAVMAFAAVVSSASLANAQAPSTPATQAREDAIRECTAQAMREVPIARAEPNDPNYSMRYNVYAGCLAIKKMNP